MMIKIIGPGQKLDFGGGGRISDPGNQRGGWTANHGVDGNNLPEWKKAHVSDGSSFRGRGTGRFENNNRGYGDDHGYKRKFGDERGGIDSKRSRQDYGGSRFGERNDRFANRW